jgi:hypothetical protein
MSRIGARVSRINIFGISFRAVADMWVVISQG